MRRLMAIPIPQIPNCEVDQSLVSNSSAFVTVSALYSPMASKPTSCIFESLRMSQTLAENDTISVILSCLHIPSPSLTHIYQKIPFRILVLVHYFQYISIKEVICFFTSPFLPFTRWLELQLHLWGSLCSMILSVYIEPHMCFLLFTPPPPFPFHYSFVGLHAS